ncbi:MAG TPA: tetratricopeptide repeat protein [Candidatus Binatia bacterium]|nr:tetratricopeptide repeat protein [Candidatus Binatia bacterium]
MRRWLAAGMLLALAACQPADPLALDRATCADADAAVEPRVAACTRLIESGEGDDAARAEWQALRGDAYYEADSVTPALRAYEAALRLDESNARALEGRAGILLASGQLDAAEPLVDRLIEAGNASANALRIKGDIELQRGAYTEAIEHFDDAISADGRLALAYAHRARAKERLQDNGGARADYDAAIRFDGTLAEARAGRCWLNLREERDLAQARNDAEAAVAADSQQVDAQLCRGILQLRGGEWENARRAFEAALQVEPGNPTALFGRGVARRRSGEGAGREDMNQARDFDSHIGEAFDEWGVETF